MLRNLMHKRVKNEVKMITLDIVYNIQQARKDKVKKIRFKVDNTLLLDALKNDLNEILKFHSIGKYKINFAKGLILIDIL